MKKVFSIICLAFFGIFLLSAGVAPAAVTSTGSTFNPSWTKDECVKAGGDWIPEGDKTSGDYCFAKQDINYTPQISIGGGKIANLGDYVAQAYNYALGFVLMIAIIMVMIGGVQWIMARGGGGVEAAKKRISNAVLGVVLLLAAYLILNTVSPAIVKLSLPRVPLNKTNKFAFSDVSNCGGYKDAASCGANAVGMNKGWNCVAPIGTTSTGCKWDAASKTCNIAPPAVSGGLFAQCPNGNECQNNLKCVKPSATLGCTACTDGNDGSPCSSSSDCNNGLTCDDNTKQCRGDTNRPIGSSCTAEDAKTQCATGYCNTAGGGPTLRNKAWLTLGLLGALLGSTTEGRCASPKTSTEEGALPCPGGQFRGKDVYTGVLKTYFGKVQSKGTTELDKAMGECRPQVESGKLCFLSGECQSGSCSSDSNNSNANDINQILNNGRCQ
jgi:hypothetical protein